MAFTQVDHIVEVDAGQNGEHEGLKEGHEEIEGGQAEAAKREVEEARAASRATAAAAKARVTEQANARAEAEEAVVAARIAEAETAIGKTRDAAMTNVSAIASDTAAAIVERLTGKAPTATEAAAAVKGAA